MRNIYCWGGEAMLDAGFWMLDTGLALKFHPVSSIQYPASSTPQVYSLIKNLTHLLNFWPNKTVKEMILTQGQG